MTELRTLKDFEKQFYSSGGYGSDGYLATEDKYSLGQGHLVEIDELKQEAIKWVKFFDEHEWLETQKTQENPNNPLYEYTCIDCGEDAARVWIINFFNL